MEPRAAGGPTRFADQRAPHRRRRLAGVRLQGVAAAGGGGDVAAAAGDDPAPGLGGRHARAAHRLALAGGQRRARLVRRRPADDQPGRHALQRRRLRAPWHQPRGYGGALDPARPQRDDGEPPEPAPELHRPGRDRHRVCDRCAADRRPDAAVGLLFGPRFAAARVLPQLQREARAPLARPGGGRCVSAHLQQVLRQRLGRPGQFDQPAWRPQPDAAVRRRRRGAQSERRPPLPRKHLAPRGHRLPQRRRAPERGLRARHAPLRPLSPGGPGRDGPRATDPARFSRRSWSTRLASRSTTPGPRRMRPTRSSGGITSPRGCTPPTT